MQGECLCDCPFIAALASIAWVNRNFIINNIASPNPGTYTVNFWDYPAASYPPPVPLPGPNLGIQLNPVATLGNPQLTPVVVNGTIPLDSTSSPIDTSITPNMYYGAGSSNNNEIWPSVYEKAYAKFCLYKNQIPIAANGNLPLTVANLADPTKDPTFSEVQSLTQVLWGGNAGIGMMYLTGLNCWAYNLYSTSFTPIGGLSGTAATTSIYTYIKTGFCSQNVTIYGVNKTRYPLVAWTYPSENASPAGLYNAITNPNGIQYDPAGIIAGHCYPVLGVFSTVNGNYIALRTTFGVQNPNPNIPALNPPNLAVPPNPASWSCYDALFRIGAVASVYPSQLVPHPNNISINLSNGIFGIEGNSFGATGLTTFQNYFAAIGWAQGF
jgi:hypothetical protein